METVNTQPAQTEVSLRTLNSDVKSAAVSGAAPAGEIVRLAVRVENTEPKAEDFEPKKNPKIVKNILLIILLMAMAAAGYFYLYPRLRQAFSSEVIL